MASLLVFFLLFLLPFSIAPFGVTQFENPKVIFAEIGIIVLFLIVLFSNKISFTNRGKQLVLFGAIFVVTIFDLFFFKTNLSFFGNVFRMQGIFLLWILLLFSFLSTSLSFKKIPWWVFSILLYLELLVTFFLPLNASQRYVGTLGEPNALAAFAVFLWPFGWYKLQKNTAEVISKCLLLVPVIILLFLSGSRSGMIAFGIEIAFLLLQKWQISLKKAVFICLLIYACSYIFPFFEQTPYENRTQVWQSALYAGIIHPGIGHGFGNTEIALHNAAAGLDLPIQYYYVDSSHNIFLDWWVQAGFIGVSILVCLVAQTIASFIRNRQRMELVILFGILTVLSFNPASVAGLLSFWWILGQGFSYTKEQSLKNVIKIDSL